MRLRRAETLWAAMVAVVILLGIWWIPGSGSTSDSYSTGHGGRKALFLTLDHLLPSVERTILPMTAPEHRTTGDRLLLIGPARNPTGPELQQLYLWVLEGNSLVYAARSQDPEVNLDLLGIRITSRMTLDEMALDDFGLSDDFDSDPDDTAGSSDEGSMDQPAGPDPNDIISPDDEDTNLLPLDPFASSVEWDGRGTLELVDDDWEILLENGGEPCVVRRQLGAGTIVVASSDDVFTNATLLDDASALLAVRIIEQAPSDGTTWFDESLNEGGGVQVIGLLFNRTFRPLTLQLILIAVVFGWAGSRRFGPVLKRRDHRRRSIVEHAEALGSLYYRGHAGPHAVSCMLEHLRLEIRSRYGHVAGGREMQLLMHLPGIDGEQVMNTLKVAAQVADGQVQASNVRCAELIRQLAELRNQLDHETRTA